VSLKNKSAFIGASCVKQFIFPQISQIFADKKRLIYYISLFVYLNPR